MRSKRRRLRAAFSCCVLPANGPSGMTAYPRSASPSSARGVRSRSRKRCGCCSRPIKSSCPAIGNSPSIHQIEVILFHTNFEVAMSRAPLPPFNRETAAQKARMAEDAWNLRDPERVALAYTEDSRWRNRSEIFEGRAAIVAFLTRKWAKEHEYRLIKDLWAFDGNRIAVRFQ